MRRCRSFQTLADHGGNSNPAGLGQCPTQELAANALKLVVAGIGVFRLIRAGHRGKRLFSFFEPFPQQDAFKILGSLVDLSCVGILRLPLQHTQSLGSFSLTQILICNGGSPQPELRVHKTSNSACSPPAALMACRMATMSCAV